MSWQERQEHQCPQNSMMEGESSRLENEDGKRQGGASCKEEEVLTSWDLLTDFI